MKLNRKARRRHKSINRSNASRTAPLNLKRDLSLPTDAKMQNTASWRMALMGTAALGAVAISGTHTSAQVVLSTPPTAGADTITITGTFDPAGETVDTLGGDDTVTDVLP